jgi:hypothetical protein
MVAAALLSQATQPQSIHASVSHAALAMDPGGRRGFAFTSSRHGSTVPCRANSVHAWRGGAQDAPRLPTTTLSWETPMDTRSRSVVAVAVVLSACCRGAAAKAAPAVRAVQSANRLKSYERMKLLTDRWIELAMELSTRRLNKEAD